MPVLFSFYRYFCFHEEGRTSSREKYTVIQHKSNCHCPNQSPTKLDTAWAVLLSKPIPSDHTTTQQTTTPHYPTTLLPTTTALIVANLSTTNTKVSLMCLTSCHILHIQLEIEHFLYERFTRYENSWFCFNIKLFTFKV